jgi:transcription elongation factor GreA
MGAVVQVQKLSREAFDRLRTEYDDLTTRGRIEIAKKIETAREMGDLSENGDYHAAKEEQGKMEGRIAHLTSLIANAEIVVVEGADDGIVQAGCIVSIRYDDDDEVERYLIGSIEERRDDVTIMSAGSPLGRALIGASVGDTVTYDAPAGPLNVTVVDAEY